MDNSLICNGKKFNSIQSIQGEIAHLPVNFKICSGAQTGISIGAALVWAATDALEAAERRYAGRSTALPGGVCSRDLGILIQMSRLHIRDKAEIIYTLRKRIVTLN